MDYDPKNRFSMSYTSRKVIFPGVRCFFHVSPYNSLTETPEDLPCWHSKVNILLEQLWVFSLQYQVLGSNVIVYN
jgi:hypothetical protein